MVILNYLFTALFIASVGYAGYQAVTKKMTVKDKALRLPLLGVVVSFIGVVTTLLFLASIK